MLKSKNSKKVILHLKDLTRSFAHLAWEKKRTISRVEGAYSARVLALSQTVC
jgi:hypothetical protein